MVASVSTAKLLLTENPLYGNYNFLAYSAIIFANNTRNPAAAVVTPDLQLVADCDNWTKDQWSNFTFVYGACGDLQTVADINGIGVLFAIVITLYITFALSLIKMMLMLCYLKEDKNILILWRNKSWEPKDGAEIWAKKSSMIIGKIILGLADQQMVTRFASLPSHYSQTLSIRQSGNHHSRLDII
jgi:hypothetical protein